LQLVKYILVPTSVIVNQTWSITPSYLSGIMLTELNEIKYKKIQMNRTKGYDIHDVLN